jgi:hypothetical protein
LEPIRESWRLPANVNAVELPGDSMSAARFVVRVSLVLSLALVAACTNASTGSPNSSAGPGGSPGPSVSPAPSAASSALILRVTTEGGFIAPAANLATVPTLSVYGDGRILAPGPVDMIYPGPLLTPIAIHDVGPAGAQAIVAAIRAAGLDKPSTADPGIPGDTGTTVIVVTLDGATTTTRMALGGGAPGPGGPGIPGAGSPDPAQAAAISLLARLEDPAETWGAASVHESMLVQQGYLVFVAPGAPVGDSSVAQAPVAWPLATPLASFGSPATPDRGITGLRQAAVLGADAATLGPVLAKATVLTPFTSGGSSYTLYVRPLLPDEVPA